MQKIGLTGSIAVGKTFVCNIFRELGCNILDADQTAREVVEPGTVGLRQIVKDFGDDILLPDERLNRKKLGAIVFEDAAKRDLLNSIVHPLVIETQDKWIKNLEKSDPEGIAIIDAALMIESGGYKRFERLIVVWCEPEIQLKRLMLRDELSAADARKRIAAQMPQDQKKGFADYLIDTSGDLEDVKVQTRNVVDDLRHPTR